MPSHPSAPSGSVVGGTSKKKPSRRRKGGGGGGGGGVSISGIRSRITSLLGTGRLAQAAEAGLFAGEVIATGGAASALSGYREAQGKSLKLGPVDTRVLAGLGFYGGALWNPKKINVHLLNVGTGFLSSFTHEAAFETGARYGKPAVDSSAVVAESGPTEGLVIGNVRSGFLGLGKEAKLRRLEKRESKIETKIEKVKEKLQAKGKLPAAAAPAAHGGGHRVVTVPRGVNIRGPRGHILPSFRQRYPVKAQRIEAGWAVQRT